MNFLIADTFMKSLERLEKDDQNQVKQAAFEFQANPDHPGASFHKLDRARDKRFWSVRVNRDIRIIVHRDGAKSLMLCYADHHDPAYHWAERRMLDVHPKTGAAQFVEVAERVHEVVREVVREQEPALFEKFEKDYLLGLGVPGEWVDSLRTVGETAFLAMAEKLPEEAAERLMRLAAGEAVPLPVAAVAGGDGFDHPDAQRRFYRVDSGEALQAALAAPWDRWRIFLHPEQRSQVQAAFTGPARVTGGAGTGKSVVALHRAAWLARSFAESRVLLTTYSKALAVRLEHNLRLLLGNDPARERITVRHLHAEAVAVLGREIRPASPELLRRLQDKALHGRDNEWLTAAFVRSEWEHVVEAHGLSTWEQYRTVSRKGRGVPLSLKRRKWVWAVMELVFAGLQAAGKETYSLVCAQAEQRLASAGARYQHVVVDESQDFGPAELRLLRALAEPGPDDLFLCGDEGQRIYKARTSWKSLGIDLLGRSKRLTLNYRTTAQIRACADALMPALVQDGDGTAEPNRTQSVHSGPEPVVVGYKTPAEEQAGLEQWLQQLAKEGIALHEIALLSRSRRVLTERGVPAVQASGWRSQELTADEVPVEDQVVVGTFHGAKGLEFRAVALVGCDADQVPLRAVAKRLGDEADREDFLEQERHLLYVACTRARDRLRISYCGKGCSWLAQG